MLDLKRIREETQFVRDRLSRRGKPEAIENIDKLLQLDGERRVLITQVETARARRNEVSPQVGKLKQAGKHEAKSDDCFHRASVLIDWFGNQSLRNDHDGIGRTG